MFNLQAIGGGTHYNTEKIHTKQTNKITNTKTTEVNLYYNLQYIDIIIIKLSKEWVTVLLKDIHKMEKWYSQLLMMVMHSTTEWSYNEKNVE